MKNTKFNLTVSKEGYTAKPTNEDCKKMAWIPSQYTLNEVIELVHNGYSICGNFGFTEEFRKGRTKDNWKNTPFMFFDLDDVNISWGDLCKLFINRTDYLKPSFIYQTFSHNIKGNRYRLVYFFDDYITKDIYTDIWLFLSEGIEDIIKEKFDDCSKTYNQVMHGTNKDNKIVKGYNTLSLVSLVGVINNNKNSLVCKVDEYTHTAPIGKLQNREKIQFTQEEKIKLVNNSFTSYLEEAKTKYNVITDNWEILNQDIAYKWEVVDVYTKKYYNRKEGIFEYYKIPNGKGRRKAITTASKRIYYINPNIDKYELLYNVVNFFMSCIMNNEDLIRWKDILDIVEQTINSNPNDYIEYRRKNYERRNELDVTVKNPYTTKKRKYNKEKEENLDIYKENTDISIEEIQRTLKVSKRTAYNYQKQVKGISKTEEIKNKRIEQIKELMKNNEKITAKEIMKLTNIPISTVYKLMEVIKEANTVIINIDSFNNNTNATNNGDTAIEKFFKSKEDMELFLKNYNIKEK